MAVTVETLDKLERRITLTLQPDLIEKEVSSRLKKISRTFRADGFRPGKVPMSIVINHYGSSVHKEVLEDQINKAFDNAVAETKIKVAGISQITPKENTGEENKWSFDVTFEIYPEVQIGDLTALAIEHISTTIPDSAIEEAIDLMRKEARTFFERPAGEPATDGDRVTVDFEGKIDGVIFNGGQAENFQFVMGENSMPEAFEKAVRGMKQGESKTFLLQFPDHFKNETVAGKEADFLVTLCKIEAGQLPELDQAFIQGLGVAEGTLEALRTEVRSNLQQRLDVSLIVRNQNTVMKALLDAIKFDVPKIFLQSELKDLVSEARENQEPIDIEPSSSGPSSDTPTEAFQAQAEHRVRLSLIADELASQYHLHPTREEIQNQLPDISKYLQNTYQTKKVPFNSTELSSRLKSILMLKNVADFVLSKANVIKKEIPFEEMMRA